MAGLLGFTIDDLTGAIDSRKRQYGNLVRGLLSDPAATVEQLRAQDAEAARGNRYTQMSAGSVMPEVAQQGQEAMLNAAMNVGGLLGITAYHGSPHTFDKFDMSKVGTGEGAQAYGHGLYFAESPGVAETYKRTLSQAEARDAAGNLVYSQPKPSAGVRNDPRRAVLSMLEIAQDSQSSAPFQFAAKRFRDDLNNPNLNDEGRAYVQKALDILGEWQEKGVRPVSSGNLYKVDIPDEAVSKMLDWDKPLSQQPEAVRNGVRKAFGNIYGERGQANFDAALNLEGAQIVERLSGRGPMSSDMARRASEEFRAAGIPGIRYLDAASRPGAMNWEIVQPSHSVSGEWIVKQVPNGKVAYRGPSEKAARAAFEKVRPPPGTSNFVLFDDKLPKILSRE